MAEPDKEPESQEPLIDSKGIQAGGGKWRQFIVLCTGVVVIAAGAGYGAGILGGFGGTPAPEDQRKSDDSAGDAAEPKPYQYLDFEQITVNLDEPRLARYVCVVVTLEIPSEEFESAKTLVEARMPVLTNWLTVYLASCSLEDTRGAANLNRIQREVLDAFNTQLWPDQKPKIHGVLFKNFTVS